MVTSFTLFCVILGAGALLTILMFGAKIINPSRFALCSWWSVPFPFLFAWFFVTIDYVRTVFIWYR